MLLYGCVGWSRESVQVQVLGREDRRGASARAGVKALRCGEGGVRAMWQGSLEGEVEKKWGQQYVGLESAEELEQHGGADRMRTGLLGVSEAVVKKLQSCLAVAGLYRGWVLL
mmetsp:Transcript_7369/g.14406  ORF Transcript_7369/g.14406 Transcript_7369/m.14406 type:complete len:113 (+) Transcript_7369:424-762(+)